MKKQKTPRILKPLLILPPMKLEYEVVNKRMRMTDCHKCGETSPVGSLRLSMSMGSGRSQTTCKMCESCGSLFLDGLSDSLSHASSSSSDTLQRIADSPRAVFRDKCDGFLPKSTKCKVCDKTVTVNPSGKIREHGARSEGGVCNGSGKQTK